MNVLYSSRLRAVARCLVAIALLARAEACGASSSVKRGVCAQDLTAADMNALAPGVSWWYNWSPAPDTTVAPGGPAFVPMLWGDAPGLWTALASSLRTLPRPRAVLVINEPNLGSQAGLAPQAAAIAWCRARDMAGPLGIPVIGPQLAIGTAAKDTVTAWDPIQKKDMPYTWMVPYWEAFRYFLPHNATPSVGIHPYGNVGELKWAVTEMARRTGRPVWVTEFNDWKAADEDAAMAYMKEAVAYMEASADVARYAWFMARISGQPTRSLLAREPGRLTRLGELYISLPVGRAASRKIG